MKKTLLTFLILLNGIYLLAQKGFNDPKAILRPSAELGILFNQNDLLKDAQKTKSILNWGVGLEFGHPIKNKLVPFIKFNQSGYSLKDELAGELNFKSNILTIGSFIPAYTSENIIIEPAIGFLTGRVSDQFMNVSEQATGFNIGVRFGKHAFVNSRISLELSYSYLKLTNTTFRDYDSLKLMFGFTL